MPFAATSRKLTVMLFIVVFNCIFIAIRCKPKSYNQVPVSHGAYIGIYAQYFSHQQRRQLDVSFAAKIASGQVSEDLSETGSIVRVEGTSSGIPRHRHHQPSLLQG